MGEAPAAVTADPTRIVILGAAGRDFHDFNVVYRDDPRVRVVAFTATQIPGIAGRRYPPSLSGPNHPQGIPIVPEAELEALCRRERVDRVVFAYSDLRHEEVMHLASRALATGADFELLGPRRSAIACGVPVLALSAVRTGCGKSQTARWLSARLRRQGFRVAVLRHPMPYGDLEHQAVQRFASAADLDAAECTLEEREEYEPHLAAGNLVFAGVDYQRIARAAEAEAQLLLWDGGNNDLPFLRPDLHVVLVDPLRPGHESAYHPGEAALRCADVVLVPKVDAAAPAEVQRVVDAVRELRPGVPVVKAASRVSLDDPEAVRGRRVLVVDDGPTLTHGGMPYGAGYVAALRAGAAELVDPRRSATPDLLALFEQHPHLGRVLPAMGYGPAQRESLRRTLEQSDAELIVAGTPVDLGRVLGLRKPVVRAHYEHADAEQPGLGELVDAFLRERGLLAA